MMRKPIKPQKSPVGLRKTEGVSIPSPTLGWNARDSEADMDPRFALRLDNIFPMGTKVALRPGCVDWLTGIVGDVWGLMEYASPTVNKLFAATNTAIYDATSQGTVGASVTTVTSGYLQHINLSIAGTSYLMAVNGQDKLKLYNGATWTDVDNASTPAITGAATTDFAHINLHKERVWFVKKNSLDAYYLPVVSVGGAATLFPMGQIFKRGGYLMAMGTWTIDGGSGADDFAVFISSEGEVAVYQGTDPASATTWKLVGVYFIARPLGRRCLLKYNGDLLFLTEMGLFPLSKALQSANVIRTIALSDLIGPAFTQAASSYKGNRGWESCFFPNGPALMVNIPTAEGSTADQYVMNSTTGAWCKFSGWNALCWCLWNGQVYFGADGKVGKAWSGRADFDAYIVGEAKSAFNYLKYRTAQKHVKLIRPLLEVDGTIQIDIGLNTDFDDSSIISPVLFSNTSGAIWDASIWDGAEWADNLSLQKQWLTAACREGYCVAVRLRVTTNLVTVRWSSTDLLYEMGSAL